ncbi:protein FAR-RED IMPAIRED RESPONSE 1-like [Spinacia oleracea]|uniref:Protein FAR1-RELATED SEQUENCE n=1 Tax=Spinacia oleracea TaxID=3562 RepID=A0A9R0HQS5_SPIOL|nr:protein FAR-RED IMPAIRED RESPONSE 1-like [Spinacia oleracea]
MPFANFVGVNHHGQSILLGCALVSRENSDTFEWIFSHWLECMGGKAPIGILTDQDAAIRKALRSTMSQTVHRWCLWHITQKFCRKLGKNEEYQELKEDLEHAIYDSLDAEEFEMNWATVMERYNLSEEESDWLEGMYAERVMWIPAYLKHLFWAGMKTTQQVESINSFFDCYVDKHTALYEFAESYCEARDGRANAESKADESTARNIRQILTGFPIEEVFQKCYTDAKFNEVQRECSKMLYVNCVRRKMLDEALEEYELEDRVWVKPKYSRKEILTRRKIKHMMVLFDLNNQTEVPEKYILRRWRKDVERKHTKVKVMYHDPLKTEAVCRYDNLQVLFDPICKKASSYKETVDIVVEIFQLLEIRLDDKISMLDRQNDVNQSQSEEVMLGTPSSVCLEKGLNEVSPSSVGELVPVRRRIAVFDSPLGTEHEGSCVGGESVPEFQGLVDSGSNDGFLSGTPLLDPFKPPAPAHRTTSYRFRSCT